MKRVLTVLLLCSTVLGLTQTYFHENASVRNGEPLHIAADRDGEPLGIVARG